MRRTGPGRTSGTVFAITAGGRGPAARAARASRTRLPRPATGCCCGCSSAATSRRAPPSPSSSEAEHAAQRALDEYAVVRASLDDDASREQALRTITLSFGEHLARAQLDWAQESLAALRGRSTTPEHPVPEGDTVHRTADRLDAALRGARRRARRAALALGARRRPRRVAHRRGRRPRQAPAAPLRHRRHPAHPPADGGPVARRAPRARHRAGAAPPRPAGRDPHRALVGGRPAPRACSTWCRRRASPTSSATSAPTCSAPTGTRRSRRRGSRHPGGSIGDALLDQRVLAGVGTFWASEILFIERAAALDPGPRPRPAARSSRCWSACTG